ncbi:endo alpha-1,4 polygalactosaminidase [Streptomyces kaniharaensis]|uniref:Endo alpha-1,4 polygalactosaminidase n=1 Tax=Streptomyces kaniharaensis TaxID=212423 RepID=A0A6N7KZA1_9ACTN|nr:endo alpha-1,4 polygalactosaminidase [Streptomyces kaniharaensis]MQS16972.1 endo alpha-1,4 polygalactosaminidase [Streptomyces kaniharaensis]
MPNSLARNGRSCRSRGSRRRVAAALAVSAAAALVLSSCSSSSNDDSEPDATETASGPALPSPTSVALPPAHAGFDYQIAGPYTPPAGVSVVSRDHAAPPAAGMYNICYVNAFQAQSGAEKEWDPDLLLREANGKVVYDTNWNEAVLDIRTDAKRQRVAQKVNAWIDECAAKGFNAVEPDNYDSYTRSANLLTAADVEALQTMIAAHAHEKKLAIGQKNTVELAGDRQKVGLDFAVAEECGEQDECNGYVEAFGDRVYVIEYTAKGLSKACKGWGDKLSIVRRDKNVVPQGKSGNLRETC